MIHDELEHGAELAYEEEVAVPEDVIRKLLREKSRLGVFAPILDKNDIPNYLPGDIMKEIEARLAVSDEPGGEYP